MMRWYKAQGEGSVYHHLNEIQLGSPGSPLTDAKTAGNLASL